MGSYAYVIERTDNGHHKVGISENPEQRCATLQTGSSTPLRIVWTTPVFGDAYAVEQEAHTLLDRHRQMGEWFDVPREAAIGAVYGAAYRLGVALDPPPVDYEAEQPLPYKRAWAMFFGVVAIWVIVAIVKVIWDL